VRAAFGSGFRYDFRRAMGRRKPLARLSLLRERLPDTTILHRMNETETALARAADAIEAAACRDMIAAAPAEFARAAGLRSAEVGGATLLVAPGIPDTLFNRAIGLGAQRRATEADLDAVIAAFRDAGCKNYWIHWNPFAAPADVPRWLAARGFAPPARRSWAKMLREAKPLPEARTALEVREATEPETAAVAQAICSAFGMPPAFGPWFEAIARKPRWKLFAALAEARVAGGGFLYTAGSDAWLGVAGMLAEFRGRGGQRALMALRIREAGTAGYSRIFTETGEPVGGESSPALENMRRSGFRQICSRVNYAAPG